MLGGAPKKNRNKKGLALGSAASSVPGGSMASVPPPKRTVSSSNSSSAFSTANTLNGAGAASEPSSSKGDYQNKLSEQLATLEIGLEFKLDLHPEDLELLGDLGAGNGGTVAKAIHIPTKLVMARKLVHIDAKPSVRRQILRELQIMHDCRSPYIVSFYGAYLQDPHICMCMEMMDKGSLDNIYKKVGRIPEPVLGKITIAVVSGLTYLYDAHRIIHRDVKPSNVLFNSQGQIKICDFGVSGELINSIADTFVGTSTYMSPERIQGEEYTVKSDVWSLGITLIELALGRFPFSDDPLTSSDEDDETRRTIGASQANEDSEDGDRTLTDNDEGEMTLSPARPGQQAESLEQAMKRRQERKSKSAATAKKKGKKGGKKKKAGVSVAGGGHQMSILELLQHVVNEPAPRLPSDDFNSDCISFVDSCLVKDPGARPTPKQLMETKWFTGAEATKIDLVEWAKTIP